MINVPVSRFPGQAQRPYEYYYYYYLSQKSARPRTKSQLKETRNHDRKLRLNKIGFSHFLLIVCSDGAELTINLSSLMTKMIIKWCVVVEDCCKNSC